MKKATTTGLTLLAAAGHAFTHTDLPQFNAMSLGGVAVFDYDNDGFDDILLSKGSNHKVVPVQSNNGLFRNDGNGGFEDKSIEAGITAVEGGATDGWYAVIAADFNNDGWTDAFMTSHGNSCIMFENLGALDGTHQGFRQHLFSGDNACPDVTSAGAAADIDNDGLLDLFTVAPNEPEADLDDIPNATYMNRGNFVFERVVSGAEVGQWPCDAAFSDLDDDGDQDLVVLGCNKVTYAPDGTTLIPVPTDLIVYRNNLVGGDFNEAMFTDATEDFFGARLPGMWMGTAFGDPNRDGRLDLYAGSGGVYRVMGMIAPHALLLNNGDGTYTDVAGDYGEGLATDYFNWGSTFFDQDNDGFCDLATVGGAPFESLVAAQEAGVPLFNPGTLFRNNGGTSFTKEEETMGLEASASSGLARGDFNNDGRSDLVVVRSMWDFGEGPWGDGIGAPLLLMNDDDNDNNWIKVKLVGMTSNKHGVGAKVTVVARSRHERFVQAQQVSAGSSFASTSSRVLNFGLGDARARRVGVQWPNGVLEVYRVPRGSRRGGVTLELVEGEGRRRRLGRESKSSPESRSALLDYADTRMNEGISRFSATPSPCDVAALDPIYRTYYAEDIEFDGSILGIPVFTGIDTFVAMAAPSDAFMCGLDPSFEDMELVEVDGVNDTFKVFTRMQVLDLDGSEVALPFPAGRHLTFGAPLADGTRMITRAEVVDYAALIDYADTRMNEGISRFTTTPSPCDVAALDPIYRDYYAEDIEFDGSVLGLPVFSGIDPFVAMAAPADAFMCGLVPSFEDMELVEWDGVNDTFTVYTRMQVLDLDGSEVSLPFPAGRHLTFGTPLEDGTRMVTHAKVII